MRKVQCEGDLASPINVVLCLIYGDK